MIKKLATNLFDLLVYTYVLGFCILPINLIIDYFLVSFDLIQPPDVVWLPMTYWELAKTMFMVGVFEEVVFRYIIQKKLFSNLLKFKPVGAIVAASVLFGCAHFVNPGPWLYNLPQVIGAACGGLFLGWAYRKKGLLFVILMHFLYNFTLSALFYI